MGREKEAELDTMWTHQLDEGELESPGTLRKQKEDNSKIEC